MGLTVCDTLDIQRVVHRAILDYEGVQSYSGRELQLQLVSWKLGVATYINEFNREQLDYFVDILRLEDNEVYGVLYGIIMAIREQKCDDNHMKEPIPTVDDSPARTVPLMPFPRILRNHGGGFGFTIDRG